MSRIKGKEGGKHEGKEVRHSGSTTHSFYPADTISQHLSITQEQKASSHTLLA